MKFYRVECLANGYVVSVEWYRDRGLANTTRIRHDATGERDPRTSNESRHYSSTLTIVEIACTATGMLAALNSYAGTPDTSG